MVKTPLRWQFPKVETSTIFHEKWFWENFTFHLNFYNTMLKLIVKFFDIKLNKKLSIGQNPKALLKLGIPIRNEYYSFNSPYGQSLVYWHWVTIVLYFIFLLYYQFQPIPTMRTNFAIILDHGKERTRRMEIMAKQRSPHNDEIDRSEYE